MKTQKIKSRGEIAVITLAVIAAFAILNYVSDRFFLRVDLTENKQFTVSNATRKILRELDDVVTINAFVSSGLPPEWHGSVTTTRDLLTEYRNIAGGQLRVVWEDPASSPEAEARAQTLGVPDVQMQTIQRDRVGVMRGWMGIAISYAGRVERIPVIRDLPNLEYELTRAIMRVRQTARPTVGILRTQHGDVMPPEFRAQMQQMGMASETTEQKFAPLFQIFREDYNVVTLDLAEGEPVDPAVRTLIIPAGGRFDERAIFEIDQFFMSGGNLIVLAEGVDVSFGPQGPRAVRAENRMLDLLEHYGVRVERSLIMDASSGHVQVPRSFGMFTINELLPYPYFVRVLEDGFAADNPAVSSLSELVLMWASPLTPLDESLASHGAEASMIVSSSEVSWAVTQHFDIQPQANYELNEDLLARHALAFHVSGNFASYFDGKPIPPVSRDDEESALNRITLANDADREVVSRNIGGNIVVIGDADFMTGQYAQRPGVNFMMNLVDWMSLDNNLIEVRTRALRDKTINANILEEGSSRPAVIRWINLLLMPILVAAVGIFISVKRREKFALAPATAATANTAAATAGHVADSNIANSNMSDSNISDSNIANSNIGGNDVSDNINDKNIVNNNDGNGGDNQTAENHTDNNNAGTDGGQNA